MVVRVARWTGVDVQRPERDNGVVALSQFDVLNAIDLLSSDAGSNATRAEIAAFSAQIQSRSGRHSPPPYRRVRCAARRRDPVAALMR